MSMPATPKKTKNPSLRLQDPYLEREKLKYSKPLPSREHVLAILAQQGVPMSQDELARVLSITDEELGFFTRRLSAMEREGQIIINRAGAVCVAKKLDLVKCRVSGHRDGFGFAIPEDGEGNDIFLSEREMHKVMHGDRVMVRATGTDRRGRIEGRIAEVLEHAVSKLVGRIHLEHGVWMVTAEDQRISHEILIESGGENGAKQGQVVMVQIVMQPDGYRQPIGRVIEVLGNYADPGMEIEIALRKHALPHEFSLAAEEEAHATPKKVRKLDSKGRVDLRELPLVTIDGETARDFDDAVFAEKQGKGFRLVVAIADVSFYVQPGSALDSDAVERGTSVYFPRRVIPMLPEALSNGICSLNPDVDRLCMVCDMRIGAKGKVKDYSFYPAVMRSKARLTYNQVWDWLQKDDGDAALMPHLRTLYDLFKVLLGARGKRGAIDFDTVETQMLFNDQGKIDTIVPVTRNDAHRIIEECMLAANVCSANFILKNKHKCLFRVHEGPTPERLENLHNFLKLSGLTLGGGDKPTTKDYALLAEQISTRPDAPVLQTVLLRSMQQAVYTPDNNGHFGLSYDAYTHFTSPIRRYPDLLVHRTIKAILAGKTYKPGKWSQLGEHCSMTERRADDASRDVESWLKTFYMRDKIGEVFNGKISAVTSFGAFVLLDGVYVEGLVHISELGKDYFHLRKDIQALVGEKSGIRYRLGDSMTVKVVRADLESAKIDFQIVQPDKTAGIGDEEGAARRSSSHSHDKHRGAKGSFK
ncbi:ribonuclease R, partial [Paludibacterium yongneupense]|uniref:ribonuclease R n=1 Tax=Paludibacterium yongneupense TaxID=400061 RepID=UPI003D1570C0